MSIPEITVHTREEFRAWLKKHHTEEKRVAVIVHKRHTGKPAPSHRELMEEAICFGWIDTTVRRLDEDRFIRMFTRRNPKGKWSENTLRYAKELITQGKMTPEGMKYYKLGRARPTLNDDIPKNPDMPAEIKKALAKNKKARANFETFPPSSKRMVYRWYLQAKRPETKHKRIARILEMALRKDRDIFKANQKANQ